MIVAFFILLNFFLAIVVDNFMLVKEDVKEFNAENNGHLWMLGEDIFIRASLACALEDDASSEDDDDA